MGEPSGVQEAARLGRNTGFSALSFGLRIGVQVVLLVLAARILSAEAFGQYTLAIALGSVLVVVCDYGLNFLATREVARAPEAARTHLANALLGKAWLAGVALAALGVTLHVLGASRPVTIVSVVVMLSLIGQSYGSYFTAVFKGLQRFDYETLSSTVLYGTLLLTQGAVLWLAPSPVNLALCFLLGRVVFVVVCVALYRRLVPGEGAKPDPRRAWQLLRSSSPFALYTFSAVLSVQLGTIVLSYFTGEVAAGDFQKALRFAMAATIPLAIAEDVFYAYLSRVHAESETRFAEALVALNNLGAAVLVPMVSGGVLYGHEIARAVYGATTSRVVGDGLAVVMGAYLLLYLFFVSPTLMALGRERANLLIWVSAAALNAAANWLLIPAYGVPGAAWAMVITYGTMKVAFVLYARHLGLRLADGRLFARCLVPHALAFVALRWTAAGSTVGLSAVALLGLLLLWWLLPRGRWVGAWQTRPAQ